MSDTDDARATLVELIRDARFAMLTTRDADGRLVAHPMTVQEAEFDGDLWFISSATASPVENLAADGTAGVTISGDGSWVSLTGTATVETDQAKTEELWSPSVSAWFPDGPTDPRVRLIAFRADGAEFWNTPTGGGTLARVVQLLTPGSTTDDVGGREKLDL